MIELILGILLVICLATLATLLYIRFEKENLDSITRENQFRIFHSQRDTKINKSKNKKLLEDFTNYCKKHPNERFWQALRNWSEYNFIYGSKIGIINKYLEDTFYKEDK